MRLLLPSFYCAIEVVYAVVLEEDVVCSVLVQTAIKKAEELQLVRHEIWLALLYYQRETVLQGFVSQSGR